MLTDAKSYKLPLFREFCILFGLLDASRPYAKKALDRGISLVLLPGGHKEAIVTERQQENLILKSRKGFVSLAMEHNAELVPVYSFGESDVWGRLGVMEKFRLFLYHKLHVDVPFVYGRYGLPFPFKTPIKIVMGEPLKVKYSLTPSDEEINEEHKHYIQHLVSLFEKHKHNSICSSRSLNFVG